MDEDIYPRDFFIDLIFTDARSMQNLKIQKHKHSKPSTLANNYDSQESNESSPELEDFKSNLSIQTL